MPEDSALNSYKSPSLSGTSLWRLSLPSSEHLPPASMAAAFTSQTLLLLVKILGVFLSLTPPPPQQRTHPWPGLNPPPSSSCIQRFLNPLIVMLR